MKVMTIYDNLNKKKGIIPSACEKTDAPIQTIINREEKKKLRARKGGSCLLFFTICWLPALREWIRMDGW